MLRLDHDAAAPTGAGTDLTTALLAALDACIPQIDADARRMSAISLIDWAGVALLGARDPVIDALAADALEDGEGRSTVVGRSERFPLYQAVLVNGAASHIIDYDDGLSAMMGHPSVAILPALLALAEKRHVSGDALVTAHIIAVEAAARIGSFVAPAHYARGFHATATVGAMAAALGCAQLLGLDRQRQAAALGIAGVRAAGLKSAFGSDMKSVQVAWASLVGLTAAQWAARGLTGPDDILGNNQGFAATLSANARPAALLTNAKRGFHICDTSYKRYSACAGTHPTIDTFYRLSGETPFAAADAEEVELEIWRGADLNCNIPAPATGLQAKFSHRAVLTMAMLGIRPSNPQNFCAETVTDPAFIRQRDRIKVTLMDGWKDGQIRLTIRLKDGRVLQGDQTGPGQPEGMDSVAKLVTDKFASIVGALHGTERSDRLLEALTNIGGCADVAELMPMLAG